MARVKEGENGGYVILNDQDEVVGQGGLERLVATTGPDGMSLINGTQTILAWTAPDDGQIHRVKIFSYLHVATDEIGGDVKIIPGDGGFSWNAHNGSKGAGDFHILDGGPGDIVLLPGTSVSLEQTVALTGGAATVYAEMWGS